MPAMPAARRARKLAIHLGADAPSAVDAMLARQNLGGQAINRRDIPSGSIGCLGGDPLPQQGNVCFFTGTPINGPDVSGLTDADAAARLFPEYDGAFTGVFWDAQRKTLIVATDCLGMQPLYMRQVDGELTLVSETKAIDGDPDLAAWGAFISIGHPIGERSLQSGLRRVPPASVLTYDGARRRLTIHRYWQWPEPSEAWRHYDFLESLEDEIRAYAAFGEPGTVLLSGGFDSRLLLFLIQRAGIPADALIVAHQDEYGDADGRLAEAVASAAGIASRKAHPPADFFSSSAYLDYLVASDAAFPSLDLFIAKVASQIQASAVWDGLAPGFVFMPLHQPQGGFDAYVRQEIRGRDSAIWRAASQLFRPDVVDAMLEGFAGDLQTEMSRLPRDAHGLARFVIENRSRNRASMNPLKVFSNRADAFAPGLSRDFMAHAAVIPFHEKREGRLYRRLFARLDKRSLTVPFLSGAKLMPGAWAGPAYYRAQLRIEYCKFRARYPSLFAGKQLPRPQRSAFLGGHLLEEDDRWLDPQARERLKTVEPANYLVWKLLFHWKAWQWLHAGGRERLLSALQERCKPR